ncbi:DUF4886 domain-containing protein [Bacteroides sp. GD17]|jgi:hypothetical protein|uniref:DUF4886 domain-containing protein n=1 Tax=Bacteroides sp. GD17 TaxID=3139826 RepID=UPI0025EFFC8A|nr:DUF4886 domain-containing protein [uncultured Bacteroides sp.]
MKSIKFIFCILVLAVIALASCSDNNDVDLSNRKFVRIDQSSVYLTVGEKIKVTATVDEIAGDSYKLLWSVLDSNVATAENLDGNASAITAITAGKTVIKVETVDKKLMYFADLTVTEGEKAVKVLTIGSGMANDATSNYLHDIAKNAGISLVIGNMYIEGASLEDHVKNITDNQAVYQYNRIAVDGSSNTQSGQSLKSVIKSENWDYIAFEESLALAGRQEGYQTNLPQLVELVNSWATNPDVKYLLHQPWAYAKSAVEDGFANYGRDQLKMYNAIVEAVWAAKESVQADVVPSGTAIQNGRTSYIGEEMLQDASHLNANTAKFAAACTWFEALFGQNEVSYSPDNLINYDAKLAKAAAHNAIVDSRTVTELVEYKESPARVYIDFGPIESPAPFNNYRFPGDPALENLKDDKGNTTPFCLQVEKGFTGTLERGLENTLGFPKSASEDMFFSDGIAIPVSSFRMSGLTKGEKYTFTFYGHINDNNTQTEYRVIGANEGSAYLVNDFNPDRVAAVKGIEPAEDGTICIELQPGPDNTQWAKFFGINVMVVMPEGN